MIKNTTRRVERQETKIMTKKFKPMVEVEKIFWIMGKLEFKYLKIDRDNRHNSYLVYDLFEAEKEEKNNA